MVRYTFLAATAALASAASAGVIHVSPIGGGVDIQSGPALAFGAGPGFNAGVLAALHADLNTGGITTANKVTFAAVDTDSGLAMIALIDQANAAPGGSPSVLHINTSSDAPSLAFASDPILVVPSGPTKFGVGNFEWDSANEGDAFAWSNLSLGTSMTWRFLLNGPLGLDQPGTFQFASWNGAGWSLVTLPQDQLTFTSNGEFAFAANVVVPAPAAGAILALAGLMGHRRRR